MYIFNTTYHIENRIKESFLDWLREVYFSLQFHVADPDRLETWYNEIGADLDLAIREKYGDRVLGFNTLLEILD